MAAGRSQNLKNFPFYHWNPHRWFVKPPLAIQYSDMSVYMEGDVSFDAEIVWDGKWDFVKEKNKNSSFYYKVNVVSSLRRKLGFSFSVYRLLSFTDCLTSYFTPTSSQIMNYTIREFQTRFLLIFWIMFLFFPPHREVVALSTRSFQLQRSIRWHEILLTVWMMNTALPTRKFTH